AGAGCQPAAAPGARRARVKIAAGGRWIRWTPCSVVRGGAMHPNDEERPVSDEYNLSDDDIERVTPGGTGTAADNDAVDADGVDGDATDNVDGDSADADGTDADGTDADGTDADGVDADGVDGDATDGVDGDSADADGTD